MYLNSWGQVLSEEGLAVSICCLEDLQNLLTLEVVRTWRDVLGRGGHTRKSRLLGCSPSAER